MVVVPSGPLSTLRRLAYTGSTYRQHRLVGGPTDYPGPLDHNFELTGSQSLRKLQTGPRPWHSRALLGLAGRRPASLVAERRHCPVLRALLNHSAHHNVTPYRGAVRCRACFSHETRVTCKVCSALKPESGQRPRQADRATEPRRPCLHHS